mgnify:CR=1 FL=1
MKNFIIGFLALPLFVTAEPFVDYDYSEQVTEMTVITVKPNLIDDYLMGIKRKMGIKQTAKKPLLINDLKLIIKLVCK